MHSNRLRAEQIEESVLSAGLIVFKILHINNYYIYNLAYILIINRPQLAGGGINTEHRAHG